MSECPNSDQDFDKIMSRWFLILPQKITLRTEKRFITGYVSGLDLYCLL